MVKLFYLSLSLLLLSSLDSAAKPKRSSSRLENIANNTRTGPKRHPKRVKPKPRPKIKKIKPSLRRVSPKFKFHNLRYLWLNEVLGNTKRRTIREKYKKRK